MGGNTSNIKSAISDWNEEIFLHPGIDFWNSQSESAVVAQWLSILMTELDRLLDIKESQIMGLVQEITEVKSSSFDQEQWDEWLSPAVSYTYI